MTHRQRIVSIVIGLIGAGVSVFALAGFFRKIVRNGLPPPDSATSQVFYQAVGSAYGDGFVAGFALCFFLTLLAVSLGTWFEGRRDRGPAPVGRPVVVEPSTR